MSALFQWTKNPTEIEIGLGANIFGFQVDLGIKPKFGSFKSYTYETGILFPIDKNQKLMRLVKYTSYPTALFSKDVDKLSDMLGDILSAVGDVVKSAWNIATGTLSNLKDTTIDVASGIGDKIYGTGEAILKRVQGFLPFLITRQVTLHYFRYHLFLLLLQSQTK